MFDAHQSTPLQRSFGAARAGFALKGGRNALVDLAQSGSAKAILPRVFTSVPEVVFLNTSGGLTGGDRLSYGLHLSAGAAVLATTQTAERAYASVQCAAQVSVTAALDAGAHLDWLPQETILFEDADIARHTQIDLMGDASVLLVESLVLGRQAMGEVPSRAKLTDRRMVRRNGRPFWAETLRIDGAVLASACSPALLGGARALAVIALIAQNAQDSANILRALPLHSGAQMAVSGWDGRCIVRITATDSWPLRAQIIRTVTALRASPMPRVWQC